MATYARTIDALGGEDDEKGESWNEGYHFALSEAVDIAEEADDVIAELIELIDDILGGYRRLGDWAAVAETTIGRIKSRTAR